MRILATLAFLTLLTACGVGKFSIKKYDDSFSVDKNSLYISENNRISYKSIAGGFHIDNKGVFINPFVQKDKYTKNIILLGFNIVNKTYYSTIHGGVNQLGVIKNLTFRFGDDSIISLDVTNQENRTSDTISYNSLARYASYDKWESGIILISKADFLKISHTRNISCKIVGSKRSVVYEKIDVSETFIKNLKQFNEEHLQ